MIKGSGDKIAQSSLCNLITCPDSAEIQKIRAKVEPKNKLRKILKFIFQMFFAVVRVAFSENSFLYLVEL